MKDRDPAIRRQLSLYVPRDAAAQLEAVRRVLDPIQSRLIPAHVTLCREDELARLSGPELESRLGGAHPRPITLRFGGPEVFDGHGILLPCTGGEEDFHALRRHVLGSGEIRRPRPHITLAHPRNPRAPGNGLANTSHLPGVITITFSTVYLIEQKGSEPWELIQEWSFRPVDPA